MMETMDTTCHHCGAPATNPIIWRWKGWSIDGHASSAPQRKGRALDEFDFIYCSTLCKQQARAEAVRELSRLDEALNNCPYFVRESGMHGWYVRNDKRCKVDARWLRSYVENTHLFPHNYDDWANLDTFRQFLSDNRFEDWYGEYRETP